MTNGIPLECPLAPLTRSAGTVYHVETLQVIKIDTPVAKDGGGGGGKKPKPTRPKPPKLFTKKLWDPTSKEETVAMHPSSVLYNVTEFGQTFMVRFAIFWQESALENDIGSHACSFQASRRVANSIPLGSPLLLPVHIVNCVQPLKVFHEKVKTSQVYVRDGTVVSPFALLLFGGALTVEHLKGEVQSTRLYWDYHSRKHVLSHDCWCEACSMRVLQKHASWVLTFLPALLHVGSQH
jgi:hypothetical protein